MSQSRFTTLLETAKAFWSCRTCTLWVWFRSDGVLYQNFLVPVKWMPTPHKVLQTGTSSVPWVWRSCDWYIYLRYAERAIRKFQTAHYPCTGQTGPSQLSLNAWFFLPSLFPASTARSALVWGDSPPSCFPPRAKAPAPSIACLPWALPSAVTCPGLSCTMIKPTMDGAEQGGNPSGSNHPS